MKKTVVLIVLSILVLALAGVARAEDAAATYKAKCAICHGATGAGDTTMGKNFKLRPLGSADVQKLTDAELTTLLNKGKGKMPAYEGKIDIAGMVKHIRTLK